MANIPKNTKWQVIDNTIIKGVKDNPKDKIELEIGDSKQPDFKPQVKIKRWDNECNVSIRAKEEMGASIVEDGEKIKYQAKDYQVHLYDLKNGEDGATEIEVVFDKKPSSNIVEFTLEDKDVEYFYQPPLTQEEIDNGDNRPENVVGSYAVYAKTPKINYVGGKEYKTGKVGHIYRPKVHDSSGKEVWGKLKIKNKLLTVTIPQKFLDEAVYPVFVDPTFGYTSVPGTTSASATNYMWLTKGTLTENGDVTKISVYLTITSFSGASLKGLIYDDNSNYPSNRLSVSSAFTSYTPSTNWFDFDNSISLMPGDYWLGVIQSNTKSSIMYDSTDTDKKVRYKLDSYSSPSDPAPASMSQLTGRMGCYATYTASGSIEEATPNPVSATLSSVTPTSSYSANIARTTLAVALTLSVVSPVSSYAEVDSTAPNPVSITVTAVAPTSTHQAVFSATPDPVTLSLSAVTPTRTFTDEDMPLPVVLTMLAITPTSSYQQVNSTTPNSLTTNLSAQTPVSSYIQEEANTPNPVQLSLSAITPVSEYQSNQTTTPGSYQLSLSVVTPSVSYIQIETNTPIPEVITISPVSPTIAYTQIESTSLSPESLTLSAITPTSSYSESALNTPAPGHLTLSVVSPVASYLQVNSTTPDPVSLTATVVQPVSTYSDTDSPTPLVLQLTPVTPAVSYSEIKNITPDPITLNLSTVTPTAIGQITYTETPDPVSLSLTAKSVTIQTDLTPPKIIFTLDGDIILNLDSENIKNKYKWIRIGKY